jgi:hypothetical protein
MFFRAIAPRFESTSIRVEHESVGTEERPSTEPAVARCLLHLVMVHFARSYKRRNASFSALKLPSDPAPEVAYSQRTCRPRQRERPGCKVRHTWEVQFTLEHESAVHPNVQAAEWLVAGSPLAQALIQFCQRLLTSLDWTHWSSCCDSTRA